MTLNFYPTKNRIYANGAQKSVKSFNSLETALKFAQGQGKTFSSEKAKRRQMAGPKRRMFRKSDLCHYCNVKMTLEEATVDHVIPIAKGGSNRADNLVLSCEPCNKKKADKV